MPSKERNAQKRAKGECFECSSKALPNGAYCYECLQRVNARFRKYYRRHHIEQLQRSRDSKAKRLEEHRCITCGGPMDSDDIERGYVTCPCRTDLRNFGPRQHPY